MKDAHEKWLGAEHNIKHNGGFTDLQRVDGVNGKKLSPKELGQVASPELQASVMQKRPRSLHETINSHGAVGCSLSHIKCWQELVDSKADAIIIFEDDVAFCPDFQLRFQRALASPALRKGFDALAFGYSKIRFECTNVDAELKRGGRFFGTHAYMLTRSGATKLLARAFPIEVHVDAYVGIMSEIKEIDMYFTVAPLCVQANPVTSLTQTCMTLQDYKLYLPDSPWRFWLLLLIWTGAILVVCMFKRQRCPGNLKL
jgi:GR25 family glycosyltransferase involved in LPS biosynthesis